MALEVPQHYETGKVTGVEVLDIHFVVVPILVAKLLKRRQQKNNAIYLYKKKQVCQFVMANIISNIL